MSRLDRPSPGSASRRTGDGLSGDSSDATKTFVDANISLNPLTATNEVRNAHTFTAHVNVGFFRGAELADPDGLLEGTGKFMRHVKLRPGQPVDDAALKRLIRAAYADMKQRLEAE